MQVKLLVTQGAKQGQVITVNPKAFCIGRDSSCDWQTDYMIVSRRHAAIVVCPDRVLVRDLGSRNGTFVNGKVVFGECEVRHDDRLAIGPVEFRIQVRPATPPPDATVQVSQEELGGSVLSNLTAPGDAAAQVPPDDSTSRHRPLPSPQAKPAGRGWFAFLPPPAYSLVRGYLFRNGDSA
jgi:pSer/pThr/pTyr-binding forkhead associated (FHA) protein